MVKTIFTTRFTKDLLWTISFCLFLYIATHNPITRPKPIAMPGLWSIQKLQRPLFFGLAGHNYLVLRNGEGKTVKELHGLATDTETGAWKYIGWKYFEYDKVDILKVWEFDEPKYPAIEQSLPGIVVSQGNEATMEMLWSKAETCAARINKKEIPYPPYGIAMRQSTENSNSVAYTLSKCMGIDTRHLGLLTPGGTTNLLLGDN